MPKRIQRQRTKGWRMPENCVYVGRPTKWGNTFRAGNPHPETGEPMTAEQAVELYRKSAWVRINYSEIQWRLKGLDLCCWCGLDQPCHADVLLDIANGTTCHYPDEEQL